ncbi:MAG: prepilin-type N-terminal cleavage/methylation domain-containing protein [Herbinix sp.]|nr:prepilin-type N-terminal cleavage/methylation domain-containing protein [Herbinix sp.]
MRTKMNNNGMSLLELIISMTISLIVVLMIISFISAAFRVFKKTSNDVNLQMEAQTAINQMVNIAMEAKDISSTITIIPDTEFRYAITNLDLTGFSDYAILYRKDLKKIFLVELGTTDTVNSIIFDEERFNKDYLLAEYVTDFRITEVSTKPDVSIKEIVMKLELGEDSYEVTKKVKLRNF